MSFVQWLEVYNIFIGSAESVTIQLTLLCISLNIISSFNLPSQTSDKSIIIIAKQFCLVLLNQHLPDGTFNENLICTKGIWLEDRNVFTVINC